VDLAVLAVPNAALEAQLAAAAAGAPAAVIFASCQDPVPRSTHEPSLAERLRRIALDAGMAVCGGNGMGFFNLEHSLRVCWVPGAGRAALRPGRGGQPLRVGVLRAAGAGGRLSLLCYEFGIYTARETR
jgi:acyl-CoA synthetase (NDP forming)